MTYASKYLQCTDPLGRDEGMEICVGSLEEENRHGGMGYTCKTRVTG